MGGIATCIRLIKVFTFQVFEGNLHLMVFCLLGQIEIEFTTAHAEVAGCKVLRHANGLFFLILADYVHAVQIRIKSLQGESCAHQTNSLNTKLHGIVVKTRQSNWFGIAISSVSSLSNSCSGLIIYFQHKVANLCFITFLCGNYRI